MRYIIVIISTLLASIFCQEIRSMHRNQFRSRIDELSEPIVVSASNRLPEEPPEPYSFGYNVKDAFGNNQYRREESDSNGMVRGSYGYTDASGLYRIVEYIADKLGFQANIKSNEPGMESMAPASVIMVAEKPPQAILAAASVSSRTASDKSVSENDFRMIKRA